MLLCVKLGGIKREEARSDDLEPIIHLTYSSQRGLHTSAATSVEWADQQVHQNKVLDKRVLDKRKSLDKASLEQIIQDQKVLEQSISEQKVLDQVIAKLHIHALEDWYLVPKSHIQLVEGSFRLLKQYFALFSS